MAKVFLDANIFIDLIEERKTSIKDQLDEHELFVSPLSLHILLYITKRLIPYPKLSEIIDQFSLVSINSPIAHQSILGPTSDFEDNVQLHSCAEAECDFFLTEDKRLLDMKFFGKTQIISQENLK